MDLAKRSFFAILWKSTEQLLVSLINFAVTIILAWFLVPENFGIIAIIAIYVELAIFAVDSGLSQALIRKKNISDIQLNTVFYTNLILALLIYIIIFLISPFIETFYNQSGLSEVIRVVMLSIFFNSISIVPLVILKRNLNFKIIHYMQIPALILSGLIAIFLAKYGYGVWSIVFQMILTPAFLAIFLFIKNIWIPKSLYSFYQLKKLANFSFFIFLEGIQGVFFRNLFLIIIPKIFSTSVAGLYFLANKMNNVLLHIVIGSIREVSYPAMSKLNYETGEFKRIYRELLKLTSFFFFPLIFLVVNLSEPVFKIFLPESYSNASIYLALLSLISLTRPAELSINSILKVRGQAKDLFFISTLKRGFIILALIFTINTSIEIIIIGQIFAAFLSLIVNFIAASRLYKYYFFEQLSDLLPSFIVAFVIFIAVFFISNNFIHNPFIEIFFICSSTILFYLLTAKTLKLSEFEILLNFINKIYNKNLDEKN